MNNAPPYFSFKYLGNSVHYTWQNMLVLRSGCNSFYGCVRMWSVSTYASWPEVLNSIFITNDFFYSMSLGEIFVFSIFNYLSYYHYFWPLWPAEIIYYYAVLYPLLYSPLGEIFNVLMELQSSWILWVSVCGFTSVS